MELCRTVSHAIPRVVRLTIFCGLFFLMLSRAGAQNPFAIGFPLHDQLGNEGNPYTWPINSVLDHYAGPFGKNDAYPNFVEAYTGELGTNLAPCTNGTVAPCGRYNSAFPNTSVFFLVNGAYHGGDSFPAGSPFTSRQSLDYRGHSGFDYPADPAISQPTSTFVYAAHEGDVYQATTDPILGSPTTYNTFYILDASGWTTWYLHTKKGSITAATPTCVVRLMNGDKCIGHVHRGDLVAQMWNTGVGTGTSNIHLHFEVRTGCNFAAIALTGCKGVDPYGWEGISGQDPAEQHNSQAVTWSEPLWDLSRWHLSRPTLQSPALVSSSGNVWSLTINGAQFDTSGTPMVTLWHKTGSYCAVCDPALVTIIRPFSSTQLTAQITVNDPALTPDLAIVKVANGAGPRSHPVSLSAQKLAGIVSSPILLYKTPAPGGGVFLGFGGFHSATDDGTVVFNSGVDANNDNVPDAFFDFTYGSGGKEQIAPAGFSQIAGSLLNSQGELAFSAVNQGGGRTTRGVYLIRPGSSVPSKVAEPGDACPSPCPVNGPTFLSITGPFAIGEQGEVVFSAQLNGPSPTPTWVLYLYSPVDGSYTKVAADGAGVGQTPVGGQFMSQNLYGSAGVLTTGDVIFSDLVTGGTSSGGLFRFSRATKTLTKIVAQGDPAPAGVTGVLGMPQGATGGNHLVFYAAVSSGNTNQVIGLVTDATAAVPATVLVAREGQPTGTEVGGEFGTSPENPPLPFAFFGQGQGAPIIRKDGTVVFSSLLVGASTDQALFFWNGRALGKLVANGDTLADGKHADGVLQFVVNNTGNVYYFATEK